MLIAEIHGKGMPDVRDHEDYLTSTIFGHLRYLPPSIFWNHLLDRAEGFPDARAEEPSLGAVMRDQGIGIANYERIVAHFWPNHPTLGQPDLILLFTGGSQRPLIILVETKLWAEKSGYGERDQLARYAAILNDLRGLGLGLPRHAFCFLVYLTPRDSLDEIEESAQRLTFPLDRARLFRLRWQDVAAVASEVAAGAPEPARTILRDVSAFLRRRSLEYFAGFTTSNALKHLESNAGRFYLIPARLFSQPIGLENLTVQKGGWAR